MAIITATQVIADNLVTTWTASSTQPGVASAIDPTQLVREVQQVRAPADTVIVYVHWGTETQACPNPQQEPLAQQLVKAGADIVIGSGTHVLLGAGYLGGAYVDYGLGNLAFYDNTAPETDSGTLVVTAQGRHITGAVWRPATILDGVPQPLSGTPATTAVSSWNARPQLHQLVGHADDHPRHHARRDGALRGAAGAAGHHDDHGRPASSGGSTTTTTAPASGGSSGSGSSGTTHHDQQQQHDDDDHARVDHHAGDRQRRRLSRPGGLSQTDQGRSVFDQE